jgi:hypothetical protein
MGGKSGGGTSGYRYYMDIMMGLCRGPIDDLCQINANKTLIGWQGDLTDDAARVQINAPNLFGGDQKEGGINGWFALMMGKPTQVLSSYIAGKLGTCGASRGVATVYYSGEISCNNPYPKEWKFRVRRYTKGWFNDNCWNPGQAMILLMSDVAGAIVDTTGTSPGGYVITPENPGGVNTGTPAINSMNPAHIIYECLTNPLWGSGLDTALIDDTSFTAAANTLYFEGFGLCLIYQQAETSVAQFIQQVCDHIGAVVYLDRTSGLFCLRLLRQDYDTTKVINFNSGNGLLSIEDTSVSPNNLPNEIIVSWHDPVLDNDLTVRAQNIAAIRATGARISVTTHYPGLPTNALAARVAARDLQAKSAGLKAYTLELDRSAYVIAPGDVIAITDLTRGLFNLILRVGKISIATKSEGKITVEAVQDVFGMPLGGFTQPQPSTWSRPNNLPNPATQQVAREANWRDLVHTLSAANLAQVQPTTAFYVLAAGRPVFNPTSAGYDLWTQAPGAAYKDVRTGGWCCVCTVTSPLGLYDTALTVSVGSNSRSATVPGAGLIDAEYVWVTALDEDAGTATIVRGCTDTVPALHIAGALLYMIDDYQLADPTDWVNGETINGVALTNTSSAQLPIGQAPVAAVTMVGRQNMPYPPGLLTVNSLPYGASRNPVVGDQTIAWARRNRLTQADVVFGHVSADVTPELGQTVTIRVYDATTHALLRTAAATTSTSWVYTAAMQLDDGAPKRATLELEAARDGLASFQLYSFRVVLADVGWGSQYGSNWGSA